MIRVVGQDEHSHEHLLYAEKVIVRNHILEAAHGDGRRCWQWLILSGAVFHKVKTLQRRVSKPVTVIPRGFMPK